MHHFFKLSSGKIIFFTFFSVIRQPKQLKNCFFALNYADITAKKGWYYEYCRPDKKIRR